jgi:hypothetical protein
VRDTKLVSSSPYATFEVDDYLDVVIGQDVCRWVEAAVGLGCRRISLDLSRS